MRASSVLGPKITSGEFQGCEVLLNASANDNFPLAWVAYVLATAYHETRGTMQPVKEAYWLSKEAAERYFFRMYDIGGARPAKAKELGNLLPGDGVKYAGRGYPQVTGKRNYAELSKALGIDLIGNPDLLMQDEIAAQATVFAMRTGLFTGKSLGGILPAGRPATQDEFRRARPIVNGTDKDDEIAEFAMVFQEGAHKGFWRQAA
jgi:putative chitinase